MKKKFCLFEEVGRTPHLWTRTKGEEIREILFAFIRENRSGDTIVIDSTGIDVFDISFASEFFAKTLLSMPIQFPERYVVVENLTEFTRENLVSALEKTDLVLVELQNNNELELLGKYHQVDKETFLAINRHQQPITAFDLKDELGIKLQAMNERLNKLTEMRIIRRSKSVSAAGREQYVYSRII
jgi:hypothetical protein